MPYFKKYKVTIVGFDGALASAITGAMDIFSFAGVSWQRFNHLPPEPRFTVSLASLNQRPVECINRLTLNAHQAIEDINSTDILLIPTIGGSIHKVLEQNQALLPHLVRISQSGCDVLGNCSGAFLLAKAGLLNDRTATTHWGYASLFANMFSDVNLDIKQMITQSDNVYCAGGGVAFHNLCLLLIERYCGREVANQVAKAHVIDTHRTNQSAFTNIRQLKQHQQPQIVKVQEFIEDNYQLPLKVSELAKMVHVTSRTLNRQFQQWVNMRPIEYIQTIRVEQAKRLLEGGHKHIQSLALEVGYEDAASFAKLFKKTTGYTPAQYKIKFHRDFDF
ncbi:GlxA family transcriptional regulator [Glaciecola siphonariae]|uniref:GlxA family transcriptional regulator n=1 Tax=Glaciecola siphonariae TaxID=521012 RepID=A0ABV9LRY5_9ALTE